MKYGYFDDQHKEYVVQTPDTPLPWINYLGCEGFFSLISQTGGGYSFCRDARNLRITRYRYNGVPRDTGGRMYYIKDGENLWSPAFAPLKTALDRYRCRHGMGYTVFEAAKGGLSSELTCFVPQGRSCEVNRVILRNDTDRPKEIELVSAVEWCLWNAEDDMTNFQRNFNIGEVEIEGSAIYHKTEYRERRNHYAFFSVNRGISGFDTDRDAFLGAGSGWDAPDSVMSGNSRNSVAHGWAPIASHRVKLTLAPGQSECVIFVLGYVELERDKKWESPGVINKAPAKELMAEFSTKEKTDDALAALAAHWDKLLGRFHVESGDEKLDRMVNIWNQYQCMVTFNMSRSASYYESGIGRGMGFRDSCQDILGFAHMIPDEAHQARIRERILDIASIQKPDGSCFHQYQPLDKRGNDKVGDGFNDDPLWLVACTCAYIRETGDADILNAPVPFSNNDGSKDEAGKAPLFEHLRRSVNFVISHKGPHGLPLIGRADWNDCLNLNCFSDKPGESFQTGKNPDKNPSKDEDVAESVFIAGMFVYYGRQYAELCCRFGDPDEGADVLVEVDKMEQTVLARGWDGEWFLRAYDSYGEKVGSSDCEDGKIFIEPQGFCVMAGIGKNDGKARAALDSVKRRLTFEYGTCLLWPCYKGYHIELGEVSSYPPGYKENGSVFCHNNSWVSIAEATMGNAGEAFDVYRKICPAYAEDTSDIRRTEPYVYCQTIAGQEAAGLKGEGKNSWLTGTAAWTFVNVSQYLLGIQPGYDGLILNPCLPESFTKVSIRRIFRGTEYHITMERGGAPGLTVDGQALPGNFIPHVNGIKSREVRFAL